METATHFARQRSEQYLTLSQTFSHFLRHTNGRRHVSHTFEGKFAFAGFFSGFPFPRVITGPHAKRASPIPLS